MDLQQEKSAEVLDKLDGNGRVVSVIEVVSTEWTTDLSLPRKGKKKRTPPVEKKVRE